MFGAIRLVDCGEWKDCSAELLMARRNRPHKSYKMTVEDIDFQKICVNWLCRAHCGAATSSSEEKVEQPPPQVAGPAELDKVRMLNVFEPCTLQIGDRNFFVLKDNNVILSKAEWKRLQKDQLMKNSMTATATTKAAKKTGTAVVETEAGGDEGEDNRDRN